LIASPISTYFVVTAFDHPSRIFNSFSTDIRTPSFTLLECILL